MAKTSDTSHRLHGFHGISMLQGMHVLVVEDDDINRTFIVHALRKVGASVAQALDGQEGLRILEQEAFNLVVTDVKMPSLSGLEMVRRLRASTGWATPPDTPCIALSAMAMRGDPERGMEAGIDEYLTKPLDLEDLLAAIQRLASRRG